MTTILNTPANNGNEENSITSIVIGVILTITIIALFLIYGLPSIQSNDKSKLDDTININLELPAEKATTPDIKTNPAY